MKRGFTLIETVVTVGIVAAMAAVVIPQVARQFDAADPTRIQNDLKNVQTAIETFNVNVKTLPGDLEDLANLIDGTPSTDSSLSIVLTLTPRFTAAQSALWKGPYIDAAILENGTTEAGLLTGYGAKIVDSFVCFDAAAASNGNHGVSNETGVATADNVACNAAPSQPFLALQITGIACDDAAGTIFRAVNDLFDGTAETDPESQGRVRCVVGTAATLKDTDVDVVYFLAVPIS